MDDQAGIIHYGQPVSPLYALNLRTLLVFLYLS